MSAQAQELEAYLNSIIEQGAGLEEIMAAVDALPHHDENLTATDDMGRPVIECQHQRGYWNIRDASGDDAAKARNLAEWALRKHADAEQAQAEITEAADAQVAQVRAWEAEQKRKHERRAEWFLGVLDQYQQDFAPDEKTTKLVGGSIVRRKCPPVLSRDEAAALAWALARLDVDALAPRKLSVSAVNAVLTKKPDGRFVDENGEVVAFQRETPNPLPYKVTVAHAS